MSYPAQLAAKERWLGKAFRALSPLPKIKIIASSPFACRWRLRLHRREGGGWGFYRRSSRDLVAIDQCLLAPDRINDHWEELRALAWPGLGQMEILAGEGEGSPLAFKLFGQKPPSPPELNERWQVNWPGDSLDPEQGIVYYQEEGLSLRAWPGIFSQANWAINRRLIAELRAALAPCLGKGLIWDLFAGSGNLSLPLARAGAEVWAVEGVEEACRLGAHLARQNDLPCRFVNQAVEEFLQSNRARPQAVIMDPPRGGMKGLMHLVLRSLPPVLACVSCHPPALAREAAEIIAAGYTLTDLTLLDMFAQTSQMECLAVFRK
jgi:23S rRNA (uracil1939-C5)-methyltransferase